MKKDGLERVADGLPQTIEEAAMSDVAFMAQEAKNFKDFVNKFFKEFKQMSKNRESLKWLEDTYKSINESINEDENPCWKGYEMVGMKMKDGKEVPNCVPKNEVVTEAPIKIKRTITKKEWNKKHKDFKLMGKDGIPYIMVYDDKIGTHLVPVKIIDEVVDKGDLKNAKFRLKKVLKYLDIEYKETRGGKKYVQINYIPVTTPQYFGPEFVNVRYEDENDLQNIGKALKLKLKESVNEGMVNPRKGHTYYQLTKDFPVKYITGKYGMGLEVPGVLIKNKSGYIDGKKGAYLIDYFDALYYVDMKKKFASPVYSLRDQDKFSRGSITQVDMAPEFSDWNKFVKESVNENDGVYFKSYTHAIEAAEAAALKKGYTIDDDEMFTKVGMNSKRPSVGKTTKVNLELLRNGKPQKKMLHIQVYGMKNGYELNAYIN